MLKSTIKLKIGHLVMKSTDQNTSLELEKQVNLGNCNTNSTKCFTLNEIQEHVGIQDTNEIISNLSEEISRELTQTNNLSDCINDHRGKSTNNEEQEKDCTQKTDNPNLSDFNFDDSAADDILGILQIGEITNAKMFDKTNNIELDLREKSEDNSKNGNENYPHINNIDVQEITKLIDTESPMGDVSINGEIKNQETNISTKHQLNENKCKANVNNSSLETNKELETNSCIYSNNQIERNKQELNINNCVEIVTSPELQTKNDNLVSSSSNNHTEFSSNNEATDLVNKIDNQKNYPKPLIDSNQNSSEPITDVNKSITDSIIDSGEDKEEIDDETTIKLKKAIKVAINELLQKVIGKHEYIAKCNQENKIPNNEVVEITENVENKDMQNITKSAICALFKKSYSNNSENHRSDGHRKPTLLQHIIQSEISETSTKAIQSILNEIRILPNKDILLLYLKLLSKCKHIKSGENTTEPHLSTSSSQLEKLLKAPISSSSKNIVESIVNKVNILTRTEYLFLHLNLPKWKKMASDSQANSVRCGPTISQSIMWLITSFELNEFSMIPKQNVYIKYQLFCQRNKLKPIGTSDFGKMVKKVYPNLTHRRQVVKGKAYYNYGGLKYRFELPVPRLPKLSEKGKIKRNLFSCHSCCEIYSSMHNLKIRSKPLKEPKIHSTKKTSTKGELSNNNKSLINNIDVYSNNHYKSSIIDGKEILVHDPLELLNVTTKNNVHLTNDTKVTNFAKRKLLSKNHLFKIKYKPYRHPSVIELLEHFQNVLLPCEVYKSNINPVVILNNAHIINYCAIHIKNLMNKLNNLNIKKKSNSNIKITCTCCNKLMDKCNLYSEKLLKLKENMSNIKIKHSTKDLNYKIIYELYDEQLTNAKNDIFNEIASRIIKKSHTSVQKLLQKNYSNLTLPESVFECNISPVVLLDKGMVLKWYQNQVSCLKEKLTVLQVAENDDNIFYETNDNDKTKHISAPRQSRAKLMNFCEIDSNFSDSDDETLIKNRFLQKATLQQNVLKANNFLNAQNRKRTALDSINTTGNTETAKKKLCVTNITADEPVVLRPSNESRFFDATEIRCIFCYKQFYNKKEMFNHERKHLRCKSCNYKFKNVTIMRDHLVKHCTINNAINTPLLKLHRVDSVKMIVKKFPDAFKQLKLEIKANRVAIVEATKTAAMNPILNAKTQITYTTKRMIPNIKVHNIYPLEKLVLPANSNNSITSSTLTLKQASPNLLHIVNQPATSDNIVYQPTIRQAPFQLKNTISSNLNKILLLSSNTVAPSKSSPSSNVLYGLYVTNANNTFNNRQNTSDCALNTFPSCSSLESTNFMQIVETPNPTIIQYSPKIPESTGSPFEHRDHSYHQPLYINENVPASNNIIMVNDVPKSFEIPPISTSVVETPSFPSSFTNATNQPQSTNTTSLPGPFRIRVKNISELS